MTVPYPLTNLDLKQAVLRLLPAGAKMIAYGDSPVVNAVWYQHHLVCLSFDTGDSNMDGDSWMTWCVYTAIDAPEIIVDWRDVPDWEPGDVHADEISSRTDLIDLVERVVTRFA